MGEVQYKVYCTTVQFFLLVTFSTRLTVHQFSVFSGCGSVQGLLYNSSVFSMREVRYKVYCSTVQCF